MFCRLSHTKAIRELFVSTPTRSLVVTEKWNAKPDVARCGWALMSESPLIGSENVARRRGYRSTPTSINSNFFIRCLDCRRAHWTANNNDFSRNITNFTFRSNFPGYK
ncbi:hypothetical protein TNCV_4686341 [Trichonephila clavipes]|nr:hypothetical protein TNCV_4686341 [Trichonephila clavipes]